MQWVFVPLPVHHYVWLQSAGAGKKQLWSCLIYYFIKSLGLLLAYLTSRREYKEEKDAFMNKSVF